MTIARRTQFLAAAVALAASALAAPAAWPQALAGDDLRALTMTSADVNDGKALAASACASCHGEDGNGGADAVPHIAGQRPVYLYRELKADQRGERPASSAGHSKALLKFFTDEALAGLAAYYASLDPAPPAEGAPPSIENAYALGKAAAEPCGKCHGDNGVSRKEGVPSLIGLNPKYLLFAAKAYKDGDRTLGDKDQDMTKALKALTDQDLQNVALYYAAQSEGLARAQTPVPAAAPLGKDGLAACVKCHGVDGVGSGAVNPSLAGQDATYMINALKAYKTGARDDDTMGPKAKKLGEDEMKSLAAYYAGLEPKPSGIPRPLGPDEWAEKCDRCHGVNGNSVRPDAPALAAQRASYLEAALKAYRSGARTSPEMTAMASILTDDDIRGLAAHYAFQKARPVVFVPIPSK